MDFVKATAVKVKNIEVTSFKLVEIINITINTTAVNIKLIENLSVTVEVLI